MVDITQTHEGCTIHLGTPIKFQLDPKTPLAARSRNQGFIGDSTSSR